MIVGNFSDYMNKPEPETKKNTSKINTEDLEKLIDKYSEYESDDLLKEFFKMTSLNREVLNECNNHQFKYLKHNAYICENCNGIVDTWQKMWYEKGREHEKQLNESK